MSVGVSVVDVPAARWGWLSLATGVAVVDAVAPLIERTGFKAGLKWPNDVLVGGGKLAGILAEVARPVVVVGFGLNVTQAPEEVGSPGATSLLDLGVAAPDRDRLVAQLLRELGGRIAAWRAARGADPAAGRRLPGAQPDHRVTACAHTCPAARRSSGPRAASMTRAGCAWQPRAKPSWFRPVTWCICASSGGACG